jgi:hypothetical protein
MCIDVTAKGCMSSLVGAIGKCAGQMSTMCCECVVSKWLAVAVPVDCSGDCCDAPVDANLVCVAVADKYFPSSVVICECTGQGSTVCCVCRWMCCCLLYWRGLLVNVQPAASMCALFGFSAGHVPVGCLPLRIVSCANVIWQPSNPLDVTAVTDAAPPVTYWKFWEWR